MSYDLLLRNGRVVDGSGMSAFWGDVGIAEGKIVEVGKLRGSAQRVIDVQGQVIAPGFIDNHCHFDAQALWDPLCTFACYHGATTVINGNCSLGMAPSRPDDHYAVVSMLSRVEAIPLASIQAGVQDTWETIPEYLALLDRRLGVNVGALIGFSAVRRYVMGDAAYTEPATPQQIDQMKAIIREGISAGAIGLSFERNPTHHDLEGRLLPCNAASNDELIAVAATLAEVGAGTIQIGGNERNGVTVDLLTEIALASGRPVICRLGIEPSQERLDSYTQAMEQGARLIPMMPPFLEDPARWTINSVNNFDLYPTWRPVIASSPAEKKRAFGDPAMRDKLRAESLNYRWADTCVSIASLAKNQQLVGRSVAGIAQERGQEPLDAFLDLVVEEDLATVFMRDTGAHPEEKGAFLANRLVMPGLSDGGAHVTRRCDSHFSVHPLVLGPGAASPDPRASGSEADLRAGLRLRPARPRHDSPGTRGGPRRLRSSHGFAGRDRPRS